MKTVVLKFKEGRDNAMVGNISNEIDGVHGHYIVLADARFGIKPAVDYSVEIKPMKSKNGFVVLKATEVRDELDMKVEGDSVSVYVKKFGTANFLHQPNFSYDRTGETPYEHIAERIKNANRGYLFRTLTLTDSVIGDFVKEFLAKCKGHRAGEAGVEIEDLLEARVEGDIVNIYVKFSYDKGFTKSPLASYDSRITSLEAVVDILEDYYSKQSFIMPEEGFDAFLDDFEFICKSREREIIKEAKKGFKGKKFSKTVKLIGGEADENYED